ncbi:hypothetical protein [Anaerobutyricum hallii]|uniref:hypothetical protein n=1 Tax=Anaerobutyricum hallii TaxID=39488 RepID=UPI003995A2E6
MKNDNLLENSSNFFDMNSGYTPVAKVSPRREAILYICGLGARFGCEDLSEHSNRRD